jgi:hypothetical protein
MWAIGRDCCILGKYLIMELSNMLKEEANAYAQESKKGL